MTNAVAAAAQPERPQQSASEAAVTKPDAPISISLSVGKVAAGDGGNDDIAIAVINNVGSVLASAAWPIAFVVVAYLLRKEITGLLARLRKIRWGDFEASVEEEIQEKLGDEPNTAPAAEQPPTSFTAADLVTRPPIDAIVTAWVAVEKAIEAFARARDPRWGAGRVRIGAMPPELKEILSAHDRKVLQELRAIRNRVVHEADVSLSTTSVELYVERALHLANLIESLAAQPAGDPEN